MKTVHKFKIEPKVKMPEGATILKVAHDFSTGAVCLWALVDTDAKLETRFFAMAKTGEPMAPGIDDCPHLETIVVAVPAANGGIKTLVTHVWEVPAYLAKPKA